VDKGTPYQLGESDIYLPVAKGRLAPDGFFETFDRKLAKAQHDWDPLNNGWAPLPQRQIAAAGMETCRSSHVHCSKAQFNYLYGKYVEDAFDGVGLYEAGGTTAELENLKFRVVNCSFTPETPVLTKGGKTKPIKDIKSGDEVEAASPEDGKRQGPRRVTATHVNHDDDLVNLTIEATDGKPVVLHTTSKHPFWDDTLHAWVPAGHLTPGHELQTAHNAHARVTAIRPVPGAADMYNLTVDQLHTYYVLAGQTSVLVHNACGPVRASAGHVYRGGLYKYQKDPITGRNVPGTEINHMPPNSINGLSRDYGPGIQMDKADHYKTASWGRSREAIDYRARQQRLIDQGDYRGAIQMDVDDIRSKFGSKYDNAIKEMIYMLPSDW
jgi:Pretoxin HINT domain